MLESIQSNKFNYQRLTEEEQQKRGILGRLVGIIADTKRPTRNNRIYSSELWEKVFDNPIIQEKIENRCLFGELGHPIDREEVDPSKIAICLAEKPKLGDDGNLYGVFDILDLPNGKILKALCDYGCNIGVSSRGSGDLITDANGDEAVDPDTYDCECWDAVLLPAVKSARLQYMTESIDTKKLKLKKALRESYNEASVEDKKIMKETFDELDLDIAEDEIPESEDPQDNTDDVLIEAKDVPDSEDPQDLEEPSEEPAEEDIVDEGEEMEVSDIAKLAKEDTDEAEDADEDKADSKDEDEDAEVYTVGDLVKELKDFDKKSTIEFKPIVIDGVEYPVEMLSFDDSDEGKVAIEIGYTAEERDNIEDTVEDAEEEVIPEDETEEAAEEEVEEKAEDEDEEAADDGIADVVESLKTLVRQKGLLEQELKSLKDEKTVNDVEVKNLKEELNKYKVAFARTSELAGKAKTAAAEVKKLTEQLNSKEQEIAKLKENNSIKLNESADAAKAKVKSLSNQLNESAEKLAKQEETYKAKLNESVQVAKQYRTKYTEAVNKYVAFRASMLGVRPADIISKLNENYSFENIDIVCDNILTESAPINNFGFGSAKKVKITEQKSNKSNAYADDDLSDLYALAGLDY